MSAYSYVLTDQVISRKPCKLLAVTLTNTGSNEGTVVIYDGRSAESIHKVATLMVGAKQSKHYRWSGLELTRGLFVDIDDKTDMVTIEWAPVK